MRTWDDQYGYEALLALEGATSLADVLASEDGDRILEEDDWQGEDAEAYWDDDTSEADLEEDFEDADRVLDFED